MNRSILLLVAVILLLASQLSLLVLRTDPDTTTLLWSLPLALLLAAGAGGIFVRLLSRRLA